MNCKYLLKIGIFSLGLGTLAIGLENAAFAQFQNTQDPVGYQKSEQDPNKTMFGSGLDPMSLIHNANLGRSRSGSDFAEDTQQSLGKAAAEFKRQQQLQMQAQPTNANPSNSVMVPATPK